MKETLKQSPFGDRVLPIFNLEAETSILGSMILENGLIKDIISKLNRDEFYRESHTILYDTMVEMYKNGIPVDLVTLCDKLRNKKLLARVGGLTELTYLISCVPTTANIDFYVAIVRRCYLRRWSINKLFKCIDLCREDNLQEVYEKIKLIMLAIEGKQ